MRKLLVLLIGLMSTMAIGQEAGSGKKDMMLKSQLQKVSEGAAERFPAEVLNTFKQGIQTVKETGIEKSAKQVGDQAVDAELVAWDGNQVQLSELWSRGPVVLMWYRGGWCPYCNVQLQAMQKALSQIEGAGAKLVVLTPELPEKAKETAEKNQLSMVALHDKDLKVARQYGIVFDLPAPIIPMYRDGLKLGSYNGNEEMALPLAATYIIDKSGKIVYAFLKADYTARAEPSEVLATIKSL